jgi:glycosyltransferase A (GT-A) superfamily protein (DUF2064 family)
VITVLGAEVETIRAVLPDFVVVRDNTEWSTSEMRDSLRLGLSGVIGTVLLMPVDCPPPPAHLLDLLLGVGGNAVLTHEGKDGHPVRFEAAKMREAMLKHTLAEALKGAVRIDAQWPGCTASWNTPHEWAARVS